MIIDAMDILYTENVDGFIIVSSDSDFTRLASRLRESGMNVIGMGESKTPGAFISACNSFKYLDILFQSIESESETVTKTEEIITTTTSKEPEFSISPKEQKKNNGNDRKKYSYSKKNKPKQPNKPSKPSKLEPQTKLVTIRKALKTIILENSDDDSWISLARI